MDNLFGRWIDGRQPASRKPSNKKASTTKKGQRRKSTRRRLKPESLEARQLLAANIFHNDLMPEDVNEDGVVSAVDALTIINRMNRTSQSNAFDAGGLQQRGPGELTDVNDDGLDSPHDVLMVINRLSRDGGRFGSPHSGDNDDVDLPVDDTTDSPSEIPTETLEGLPTEYRSIDGSGNNLENAELGTTGTQLIRVADSDYADGISEPAGEDRPSAREISNVLATDEELISDRDLSAFVYVWGQFIDHDITRTPSGEESFDIEVPLGDEYFDPFGTGTETISLTRSTYDSETGVDSAREQINTITTWIDGSVIYGSDDATATALRTLSGGLLKTSEGDLLPYNNAETFPDGTLTMDNDAGIVPDDELFAAGDVRANENIELTAIQTLFVREHNRLAEEIAAADATLSDEEIYQQARAIVVAELQAITYNEWLPAVLGEDTLSDYEGYDSTVDPTIANEFSTAAFRFGHSLLGDDVEFLDNEGNEIAEEIPLSQAFSNPEAVSENGIDSIIKYLAADPSSELDIQVVDSVRNFLFGPPGSGGFDLVSLNIQRGRDHGLSDYNTTRVAYGLDPVESFADITADPDVQAKLEQLYGSVDDIDLWVGGLVEDHVEGASVGETFQTIITDQFERLRDADRFWYENTFSGSALAEIESTTLADIIERNSELTDLQDDVFFFSSSVSGTVTTETDDRRALTANSRSTDGEITLGVADQIIQLVNDGEIVAETTTDSEGHYSFDVQDGLRTGEYEIQLVSQTDDVFTTIAVEEVAITTGDVHLEDINFSISVNDTDTPMDHDDKPKGSGPGSDSGPRSDSGQRSDTGPRVGSGQRSGAGSDNEQSGRNDRSQGSSLSPDLVDPFFSRRDDTFGNRQRS
ncbi:Planctomycete extracellular [Neorhodopirellula lusitana]|uniref:Planctomycete extracellular n=1 Tax=Neorhodopirellula lusitana TaxID=445327 RepID=A0ABY1QIC9_9BACT|nr:peroxidase family protein [Neorhodopirellula lusitana]SMP72212.1 Planctomycete extracellular [Neorhodopirellula lusitana]